MGHYRVTRTWATTGTYSFDVYNDVTGIEVIIHFTSKGYYDPGCTYGYPDDCYPPESDDERELDYVEMIIDGPQGRTVIKLDDQAGAALFDRYQKEIYDVDLQPQEDDGPEDE